MTIAPSIHTSVDPRQLRDACGDWVTGVSIVTGTDGHGNPVGMAVNSFSSLSLEPPLILFCPAKKSSTWACLRDTGRFVVNILAADQGGLSRAFAKSGQDKFAGVDYRTEDGLPILNGSVGHLACRLVDVFDGGDHDIAIGRVEAIDRGDRPPLVFHRGTTLSAVEGLCS